MSDYWDPERYALTSDERVRTALDVMQRCGYRFRGDEHVLDIGCGNGWITKAIFDQLPRGAVLGIDLSENMIAYAQQAFGDERIAFNATDVLDLRFQDEFDLVTSFACLQWVEDQMTVLKNVSRALKPGGTAILMYYNKPVALQAALDRIVRQQKWSAHLAGFSDGFFDFPLGTYREYLGQLNLTPQVLQARVEGTELSREELTNIIAGWLPHLERIPSESQGCFMDELVSLYIDEMDQASRDTFTQQWPRVEVCFQKAPDR